jgi:hypothetical protein
MSERSCDGILRILTTAGVMEGKDDMLFRYSGAYQVFCDFEVCAVMLEPDFAVTNIDMQKHIVHAPLPLPSDLTDLVVPQGIIADEFGPNGLLRGSNVGYLL